MILCAAAISDFPENSAAVADYDNTTKFGLDILRGSDAVLVLDLVEGCLELPRG